MWVKFVCIAYHIRAGRGAGTAHIVFNIGNVALRCLVAIEWRGWLAIGWHFAAHSQCMRSGSAIGKEITENNEFNLQK